MSPAEIRAIRRICKYLLMELESNFHEVVLVPAEFEQSGYRRMLRAAQYQNAFWYRKFIEQYQSIRGIGRRRYKRPRTFIRKDQTEQTLSRMIASNFAGIQAERILRFIALERANHRNKRRQAIETAEYENNGGIPIAF